MKGSSHKVENCFNLQNKLSVVEFKISDHDHRLKLLEYKSIDLEARCRRNYLLISGIPEEKDEDCLQQILIILREKLEINPCPPIPRSHSLGRYKHGSTRPIILYYLNYRDTLYILSSARK
ncbi:hypothetical protein DPMN_053933 [Dreissena polymorpha]|uniref:Uncharacterized protein n=1 Tax=Dreissena polymorpha TaxID=45954 RepID=A0A9D4CP14_DREPO|nr:hypothetical protein DPMN_053933 [Dreissena polymorpha]